MVWHLRDGSGFTPTSPHARVMIVLHLRSEELEPARPFASRLEDPIDGFGEFHRVDPVVREELGVLERPGLVADE
jgi:hypothetical protein